MTNRGIGDRSEELEAALATAIMPAAVVLGLPGRVDGPSEFTIVAPGFGEEPQAWDIAFDWDGRARYAPFWFDISRHEGASPGSSSPVHGWVSWNADGSLVIAFADPDLDIHGVVWGSGVAMCDAETNETTDTSLAWVGLARSVVERVHAALDQDGEEGRLFGAGSSA